MEWWVARTYIGWHRNPRASLAAVSQKGAPDVLRSSITTHLRCGGILSDDYVTNLLMSPMVTEICKSISCCWRICVTCCIAANVLQTNNVDAERDKLTSELSWQYFASKVANFQLPHLHLTYLTCIWCLRWGWPRLKFAEIFGIRKPEFLGCRVALFAWSYV